MAAIFDLKQEIDGDRPDLDKDLPDYQEESVNNFWRRLQGWWQCICIFFLK